MNIGKSTKVALAQKGKTMGWLAEMLDSSCAYASKLANHSHASANAIDKLSTIFEMKTSEFIALGE